METNNNNNNTNINNIIDLIKGQDFEQDCARYERVAYKMFESASETAIDETFRKEFNQMFFAIVETNLSQAKFESMYSLARTCKEIIERVADSYDLDSWQENMVYKPYQMTVEVALLLAYGREMRHRYEALTSCVNGNLRLKEGRAGELLGGL